MLSDVIAKAYSTHFIVAVAFWNLVGTGLFHSKWIPNRMTILVSQWTASAEYEW